MGARHARIRKFRMGAGEKFRMSAKVTECARAARRVIQSDLAPVPWSPADAAARVVHVV